MDLMGDKETFIDQLCLFGVANAGSENSPAFGGVGLTPLGMRARIGMLGLRCAAIHDANHGSETCLFYDPGFRFIF